MKPQEIKFQEVQHQEIQPQKVQETKNPIEKQKKDKLIIITGPTAVGKTKLSLELAKAVNGEIISADSMQVYKYMNIGTAKIKPEQMQGIPHYLIDEFEPSQEFHVVKFKEYAKRYMKEIYQKGKIPILVGGTGFYIQAVVNDIDFTENNADYTYRKELEQFVKEHGQEALHSKLKEIDPVSAQLIHSNNVKRVIRALEFYQQTKMPISKHNEKEKEKQSPYQFAYFVLTQDRNILYQKIDRRVDEMMAAGLVEEVKKLLSMGYKKNLVSMQGLGYKEIISYLEGKCSLEEAVYCLKRNTRHFAKRQLTWFKREKEVCFIEKTKEQEEEKILKKILEELRKKKII